MFVLALIIGHLLGSIPIAVLVARRHRVDLHRTGDGNPGAWNALEQLGGRRAWPAFAGDGLKAAAATGIGWALGGYDVAAAGGAGAMLGHAFPVQDPRRGGMAVMCFVGTVCALSPLTGAIAWTICAGVGVTKGFRWGARVGLVAYPLVQLAVDPVERVIVTGALMCLMGLLFLAARRRRRSGRARSATAAPRSS